jgi:hypothetical protein
VIRRTKQRKQKEKSERRSASQSKIPTVNRRNLANVRVMQRNLVYIIGLPQSVADDDVRGIVFFFFLFCFASRRSHGFFCWFSNRFSGPTSALGSTARSSRPS